MIFEIDIALLVSKDKTIIFNTTNQKSTNQQTNKTSVIVFQLKKKKKKRQRINYVVGTNKSSVNYLFTENNLYIISDITGM